MYVERQVGNQCRRHALNAFFQGGVVQWGDIENHAAVFEAFYHIPSTNHMRNDYDFFNADGSSLITWIGQKLLPERFFLVLPCGRVREWLEQLGVRDFDECVKDDPRIMVFNADHVFAMLRRRNQWYVLDSLSPTPYTYPIDRILTDAKQGIIVALSPPSVSEMAFHLEKNIVGFLNKFPGLHLHTVAKILSNGRLGDAHDTLENWVFMRLRMLAWLRGKTSRTNRLFRHVNLIENFKEKKDENDELLTYSVVFS